MQPKELTMEYKLELLQKRVNHMEDLILAINDKIGSVLDEFFNHRAKRAADEESICLSLLTKFKSSFEIPDRFGSGSGSVPRFGQVPASASSGRTSSSANSFSSESVPAAPAKQELPSPPRRPPPPASSSSNNRQSHGHNTRASTAKTARPESNPRATPASTSTKSATPRSSATAIARARASAPPPLPPPPETEKNTAVPPPTRRHVNSIETQTESIVEVITIDDEDDQYHAGQEIGREREDFEPEDSKPELSTLKQVLESQNSASNSSRAGSSRSSSSNGDREANTEEASLTGQVFGNYAESVPASSPVGNGEENGNIDEYDPMDDSDAITIYSDDGEEDSASALGDDNDSQDEAISMLCEPELHIKTENEDVGKDTSFSGRPSQVSQLLNPHAAVATTTAEDDESVDANANVDQEEYHQMPNLVAEVIAGQSQGFNAGGEEEPMEPETEADPNTNEHDRQRSSGPGRRPASNYKRVRSFNTLAEGRFFLKVNGMSTRSNREVAEGTRYSYCCKDKRCKKLMHLLENRDTGRTVLFEKMGMVHNHPAIRVILRTPRPKSRASTGADGPPVPQFKLVQTFQSRADAVHKVQEQDSGAWILNQVVECPDDVKAYYSCGLTSGRSCPVSMVLRTFNENGKVDQYVWQGEHVHDPEVAAGRSLADYFTPPETVHAKKTGRSFTCVRAFATEEEARTAVREDTDAAWEPRSQNHTVEGKKTYFFCKHRKCPMTMYLRGVVLAGKVFQYISEGQHDHILGYKPKGNRKPGRPRTPGKRGKHVPRVWAQVAAFATEDEARTHVRGEMAWTMRSWRELKDCKVIYYCCRHDIKCPVRSYVRVSNETGTATVFVTTQDAHVHTPGTANKRARRPPLPAELKTLFKGMYAQGLVSAEKMLQELQRRGTQVPAYHVFEYVARMRRLKYGTGRGRRPKVGLRKKAVVGRVLSANPKNERKRKEKAEKAAAKKREKKVDTHGIAGSGFRPGGAKTVATSAPMVRKPIPMGTSNQTQIPTPAPAVAGTASSSSISSNRTPAVVPVQVKTERPDPIPIDPQLKMSPFRKMFAREACIRLRRIETINLSKE